MKYTPNLREKYNTEIVKNLRSRYKSIMQIPRLQKICLNQGVGGGSSDKKLIESAQQEMTKITGQKALITKATKDISNFKLRKGMPVGVMVTLRGNRMFEFLERFITSTLPRVRDFQGLESRGFDGRGNFTIGIKEQIAFPEISIDKVNKITGMDITFVTSTDSDEESLILLKEFGLPFKEGSTQSKDSENKDKNKTPKDNNETPDEINIEEDNQQKDNSTDEINSEIKVEKEPSENVKENNQDLSKDVDKSAK